MRLGGEGTYRSRSMAPTWRCDVHALLQARPAALCGPWPSKAAALNRCGDAANEVGSRTISSGQSAVPCDSAPTHDVKRSVLRSIA
jgi:hypothetical protein